MESHPPNKDHHDCDDYDSDSASASDRDSSLPLRPLIIHLRSEPCPEEQSQSPEPEGLVMTMSKRAKAMLRRRRLTAAFMLLPGVLVILTAVSLWYLPSSYYGDWMHQESGFDPPLIIVTPSGVGTKATIGSAATNAKANANTNTNANTDANKNKNANKNTNANKNKNTNTKDNHGNANAASSMVPEKLLEMGVYDTSNDFVNEQGISPTGWENTNDDPTIWGPCRFLPMPPALSFSMRDISWTNRRRRFPSGGNDNDNDNDNEGESGSKSKSGSEDHSTGNATHPKSTQYYRNADLEDFEYRRVIQSTRSNSNSNNNHNHNNHRFTGGWCRPGFLIIGAGKCGTSSLYHYLMGHPRVVPAVEKQIHYFKYYARTKPLEWYYGHFPTPQSFLEHGALMTGEASPGYLPYPDVASFVYQSYSGTRKDGAGSGSLGKPLSLFLANPTHRSEAPAVPPRIIAIGREPLDRMYSSYRYNYVAPTIEHLRTKGHPTLPSTKKQARKNHNKHKKHKKKNGDGGGDGDGAQGENDPEPEPQIDPDPEPVVELHHPDDDYYKPYLFTLEDFVRAELARLRGCLFDWGPAKTHSHWHNDATYGEAIQLRNGPYAKRHGNATVTATTATTTATTTTSHTPLPQPLIDLDGMCYGKAVGKTVYREQWTEMQTNNPGHKVLLNKNLHLTQALIGRSLYTFPLEWWYVNYDLHGDENYDDDDPERPQPPIFVCTEELTDPKTLGDLAGKLGLPAFDGFDGVLADGAYNVGGHRGYDTATTWEEIEMEKELHDSNDHENGNGNGIGNGIGNTTRRHDDKTKTNNVNKAETNKDVTSEIPLPEDLLQELKEFINPLNERLFALTGKRCNW